MHLYTCFGIPMFGFVMVSFPELHLVRIMTSKDELISDILV